MNRYVWYLEKIKTSTVPIFFLELIDFQTICNLS
jgi:hypothetical protein